MITFPTACDPETFPAELELALPAELPTGCYITCQLPADSEVAILRVLSGDDENPELVADDWYLCVKFTGNRAETCQLLADQLAAHLEAA